MKAIPSVTNRRLPGTETRPPEKTDCGRINHYPRLCRKNPVSTEIDKILENRKMMKAEKGH